MIACKECQGISFSKSKMMSFVKKNPLYHSRLCNGWPHFCPNMWKAYQTRIYFIYQIIGQREKFLRCLKLIYLRGKRQPWPTDTFVACGWRNFRECESRSIAISRPVRRVLNSSICVTKPLLKLKRVSPRWPLYYYWKQNLSLWHKVLQGAIRGAIRVSEYAFMLIRFLWTAACVHFVSSYAIQNGWRDTRIAPRFHVFVSEENWTLLPIRVSHLAFILSLRARYPTVKRFGNRTLRSVSRLRRNWTLLPMWVSHFALHFLGWEEDWTRSSMEVSYPALVSKFS